MALQVVWTQPSMNLFIELSGMPWRIEHGDKYAELLLKVHEMHICKFTSKAIGEELGYEPGQIDDYIRELKEMYDDIVFYTGKLVPRTNLTKKDIERQLKRYGKILEIEHK